MTIRMLTHCLGITTATAGIILGTLLPFLPGRYDSLAVPLSVMSQIFGAVGLLLVPLGALWVASGYWSRLAGKQYGIAIAALIASSVVWGIVSLGALVSGGLLLGLGAIALWIYVVSRVMPTAEGSEERAAAAHQRSSFLSSHRARRCGAPSDGGCRSGDRVQQESRDPEQRAIDR